MRFIHTADWHLGRYFHGIHLTEDQGRLLREQFLPLVREEKADAVVIAGDIYDRAVPPVEAVDLFSEILTKLVEQHVKVLYIAGNHDSAARIGFGSRLMEQAGVFVRGELTRDLAPVVLEDEYGPVAFQLFPYVEPSGVRVAFPRETADRRQLSCEDAAAIAIQAGRSQLPSSVRSVAVVHAFVAGQSGDVETSASERPLLVGGAGNIRPGLFRDYCYTALGHIHKPQRAGADTIRYSGSLMKYSFDEASQKKGVCVVDLAADGSAQIETIALRPARDVRRIRGSYAEILNDREAFPASQDYIEAELTDDGPILNAMANLREVYPNMLSITREIHAHQVELPQNAGRMANRSAQEIFAQYYAAMTGSALSEQQTRVIQECLNEIRKEEGEQA